MALKYTTCKHCGKLFQSYGSKECPACTQELESKFKIIKEYLQNYPGASVNQVAEETEVDEKTVLHFLKEGRLEMISAEGFLTCEKCGAAISSGKLCHKCAESLSRALDSVLPKAQQITKKAAPSSAFNKEKLHVNINKKK